MKLVLVCTAVVLLMSAVELARSPRRRKNSIEQIYREANVTPVPEMALEVTFGDLEVTFGMEISPIEVKDIPSIEFDSKSGRYYTVILLGLDCPYPDDPYLSPFLLGLFVNVYRNSDGKVVLEDSCAIAQWIAVSPPPGSAPHRFILSVYRQKRMIDTGDEVLMRLQLERLRFSLSAFVRTYDLVSPPIAGTFWYTQYPIDCEY